MQTQIINNLKIVVNSDTCIELKLDILGGLQLPLSFLNEKTFYEKIRSAVVFQNGPANAAKRNGDPNYYMFETCDLKTLEIKELNIEIDHKKYTVYHDYQTGDYEYITEVGRFKITPENLQMFRVLGMTPKTPADRFFHDGYLLTNLMVRINEKHQTNQIIQKAG